jgi:vacuolar-type H+-ATPase subunit I/STV1
MALKSGSIEIENKVKQDIQSLQSELDDIEKAKARVEQYNAGMERIQELKEQEKELAREYEKLESELYLTEQFIRTKVNLLEEKINSRFKLARFKLFDQQINGGVVECCETLYQGVPYSGGLNNAARINVGLDIINTLSEHYGFTAPIFIDNREAVTKLIETKSQVISLVVSEPDKKLRVEVM